MSDYYELKLDELRNEIVELKEEVSNYLFDNKCLDKLLDKKDLDIEKLRNCIEFTIQQSGNSTDYNLRSRKCLREIDETKN